MKEFKCIRCGYEWLSRVEKPTACPKCKSYYWNKERVVKEVKNNEKG
jgi:predicted Zn-ribbon and HTH transcriptional regulator